MGRVRGVVELRVGVVVVGGSDESYGYVSESEVLMGPFRSYMWQWTVQLNLLG